MESFVWFLLDHYFLTCSFIAVLTAIIYLEVGFSDSMVKKITPKELVDLMNSSITKIIDIRTKEEFLSGHILSSENITLDKVCESLGKSKKYKNKNIVFVCVNNANITQNILTKLREASLDNLYLLKGGIEGWKDAGMPTINK